MSDATTDIAETVRIQQEKKLAHKTCSDVWLAWRVLARQNLEELSKTTGVDMRGWI